VDSTGNSFAVGFADGVVRLLAWSVEKLKLVEAFKPHKQSVVQLKYSSNGTVLATASNDCTVFLFAVSEQKHLPIGFVRIPSNPVSLSWSTQSPRLLVCCANHIIEMVPPTEVAFEEPFETYELDNIQMFQYPFHNSLTATKQPLKSAEVPKEVRALLFFLFFPCANLSFPNRATLLK
jgi:WD40 repeat protein